VGLLSPDHGRVVAKRIPVLGRREVEEAPLDTKLSRQYARPPGPRWLRGLMVRTASRRGGGRRGERWLVAEVAAERELAIGEGRLGRAGAGRRDAAVLGSIGVAGHHRWIRAGFWAGFRGGCSGRRGRKEGEGRGSRY
jgi:hypothetical protein